MTSHRLVSLWHGGIEACVCEHWVCAEKRAFAVMGRARGSQRVAASAGRLRACMWGRRALVRSSGFKGAQGWWSSSPPGCLSLRACVPGKRASAVCQRARMRRGSVAPPAAGAPAPRASAPQFAASLYSAHGPGWPLQSVVLSGRPCNGGGEKGDRQASVAGATLLPRAQLLQPLPVLAPTERTRSARPPAGAPAPQ